LCSIINNEKKKNRKKKGDAGDRAQGRKAQKVEVDEGSEERF